MSDRVIWRRRTDGALELRVNGVFVMDNVETGSERRLAHAVLERGARDVLVGGLGMGYTTRELLDDCDVNSVVVAELFDDVVESLRDDVLPDSGWLDDSRLDIEVADVGEVLVAQPPESLDAVVLDVDNGPDFLVHETNRVLYNEEFVAACGGRLRPDGTLAVWSMADSPQLRDTLSDHFAEVDAVAHPVSLNGHPHYYWILTGTTPL